MKILRLALSNLNALYGAHTIDFERDLSAEPMFLICGPTGAGKTTLLDAISLALYGKTPRLSNGHGEVYASPHHVMSTGTAECWAELEFSRVKGGERARYKATWSCRRARGKVTGAIQSPSRRLEQQRLGGEWETLIDTSAVRSADQAFGEVLDKLSVEDFHRTVILPQGEFAAFLKAPHADRSKILERLTNTSVYLDIGARASDRFSAIKQRYEAKREAAAAAEIPTDDQLSLLDAQRAAAEADAVTTQAHIGAAQEMRAAFGEVSRAQRAVAQGQGGLDAANADLLAHASERDLLALDLRCRPAADDLDALLKRRADLHAHEAKREAAAAVVAQYSSQATADQAQITSAQAALDAVKVEQRALQDALPVARAAYQQRALCAQQLTHAEALRDQARADLARAQQDLLKTSRDHEALAQQRADAAARLQSLADAAPLLPLRDALSHALTLIDAQAPAVTRISKAITARARDEATARARLADLSAQRAPLDLEHAALQDTLQHAQSALNNLLTDAPDPPAQRALLSQRLQRTQQETQAIDALLSLSQRHADLLACIADAQSERARFSAAAHPLPDRVSSLHRDTASLQRRLDALNLAAQQESLRAHLSSDHPCPVCGSLDHPFAGADASNHDLDTQRSDTQRDLLQHQRALIDAQAELKSLDHAQTKAQSTLDTLQRSLSDLPPLPSPPPSPSALSSSRADLLSSSATLNAHITSLDVALGAHTAALHAVSALRARRDALQDLQQVAQAGLQRLTDQQESDRDQLTERLASISDPLSPTSAASPSSPTSADALSPLHAKLSASLHRVDALRDAQRADASLADKLTAAQTLLTAAQTLLDDKAQTLTLQDATVTTATTAHQHAQTLALTFFNGLPPDDVERSLSLRVTSAESTLLSLQQAAADTARDLHQAQGSLHELKDQCAHLSGRVRTQEAILQQHLDHLALPSLDALQSSLLSPDTRALLTAQEATRQQALLDARSLLTASQSTLNAATTRAQTLCLSSDLSDLSPDSPDAALSHLDALTLTLQETLSSLQQQAGALKAERTRCDALRARYAQLTAAFHDQRAEYDRWKLLNDLIGSKKGQAFRDFAQSITLTLLVSFANAWLAMLNERYSLVCVADSPDAPPSQFAVQDRYQADDIRPVSTLSGGESFVVSLALALGLADCAGVSMPIETLLLDEGFGTLDADAVQVVVEALSRLQSAKNAQLGLISHVEALQRQLRAQIRVERVAPGRSRVITSDDA